MSKDTVQSYDPTAANNADIAGINIAEGCPAAGINNALRTLMAQIAAWRDGTIAGKLDKTGGAMSGAITAMSTGSTVKDGAGTERYVGYRNIPLRAATSQQTLVLTDAGAGISITTGGIIIPLNATVAFGVGDIIAIYNNSASTQQITITATGTLRLGGTTSTGARTLAVRGLATLLKVDTDEWIAKGDVT